jgi:hypothetical protein
MIDQQNRLLNPIRATLWLPDDVNPHDVDWSLLPEQQKEVRDDRREIS